ncbi:MAG: DUF1700 domain-containing protein [Oscillospiraceae bacterium]|nr:DUF1700 domain-containing protein [Oscillospiraceae bacterium]
MDKETFLARLREGLSGLPRSDAAECLAFYGELIDDRMEDGLSEAEAVAGIGPVEEIVAQTVAEIPISRLVKEKVAAKRKRKAWEIVPLALGAPVLMAAAAVALSVYAALWAVAVSLWAADAALLGVALAAVVLGPVQFAQGRASSGLALLGAGLVLAGLAILLFFGCKAAARGMLILTQKTARWVKTLFLRKEGAT